MFYCGIWHTMLTNIMRTARKYLRFTQAYFHCFLLCWQNSSMMLAFTFWVGIRPLSDASSQHLFHSNKPWEGVVGYRSWGLSKNCFQCSQPLHKIQQMCTQIQKCSRLHLTGKPWSKCWSWEGIIQQNVQVNPLNRFFEVCAIGKRICKDTLASSSMHPFSYCFWHI